MCYLFGSNKGVLEKRIWKGKEIRDSPERNLERGQPLSLEVSCEPKGRNRKTSDKRGSKNREELRSVK